MEGTYRILLSGEPVGQAVVERQGLYYRFCCRCRFSGEIMYKLTVSCGAITENLGIPVPSGREFQLNTTIPIKRLGEGEPEFRAVPRHAQLQGKFVPISPEEPFRYLTRLHNAFLEIRNGRTGVVLTEDPVGRRE